MEIGAGKMNRRWEDNPAAMEYVESSGGYGICGEQRRHLMAGRWHLIAAGRDCRQQGATAESGQ